MILAIIPARGGSRGIPQKNIKSLAGKPLIGYSIEQAKNTELVDRVIVSTDAQEIGAVAAQFGAEIVWRPAEISGDTATSESALVHVLDHLQTTENISPDIVVFLQATSPLRNPDDIQNAIVKLQAENADSLFSCCHIEGFVWRISSEGLTSVSYEFVNERPRRQDLTAEIIEENGSIYVFKPWVLRQFNNRLGGKITTHLMDRLNSFQIDRPSDWPEVERLINVKKSKQNVIALNHIKLLVFDFDGVMTDNRVLVDETGKESVWCDRSDGWGIARLRETGLPIVIISTEENPVVTARSNKLKLRAIQSTHDKLATLKKVAAEYGCSQEQIAFVGNDVNDLECLRWVGIPIAVADAVPEVRDVAHLITTHLGGHGAVREICEWFIKARRS